MVKFGRSLRDWESVEPDKSKELIATPEIKEEMKDAQMHLVNACRRELKGQ
jgi:hypothetical protein